MSEENGKKRGFGSMPREKVSEIASKGGKAAHVKGTAHEFTSEEAREAGRKGGWVTARRKLLERQRSQESLPEGEPPLPMGEK